jgi:hypothetical protein
MRLQIRAIVLRIRRDVMKNRAPDFSVSQYTAIPSLPDYSDGVRMSAAQQQFQMGHGARRSVRRRLDFGGRGTQNCRQVEKIGRCNGARWRSEESSDKLFCVRWSQIDSGFIRICQWYNLAKNRISPLESLFIAEIVSFFRWRNYATRNRAMPRRRRGALSNSPSSIAASMHLLPAPGSMY